MPIAHILIVGVDRAAAFDLRLLRIFGADQSPHARNAGMAEANMIGIAGGLARAGHVVFVNTFGVFCTRRCYDQIAMSVAYPALEAAGELQPNRLKDGATSELLPLSRPPS